MKDEQFLNHVVGTEPPTMTSQEEKPGQKSRSGLYLSELSVIRDMISGEADGHPNLKKLMFNSLSQAARELMDDVRQEAGSRLSPKKKWNGRIGQVSGVSARAINRAYTGISFICAPAKMILSIHGIGTVFNKSGVLQAKLMDDECRVLERFELRTSKRRHYLNKLDIRLPFNEDRARQFFIMYRQEGFFPLENKINCGCGQFRPDFDPHEPVFHSRESGGNKWARYMSIGGFSGNGSSCGDFDYSQSKYMNGLTLNISLNADKDELLFPDSADFGADPLFIAMAYALRYRAGGLLAENINLLPDTVEQEKLNTAGKEWNSKYRDMLGIITETQVKKTIEKAVSNGLAV